MTFVVPFDGSDLSEAALVRAREFGGPLDEDVVAVTIVPEGKEYAVEKGWLDEDEPFRVADVAARLHGVVSELVPSAAFRYERVDRFAGAGTVGSELRSIAAGEDASVVFLGSENAGQVVTPVASVGERVATDDRYDVHLVRHRVPSRIATLRAASPHAVEDSDFY